MRPARADEFVLKTLGSEVARAAQREHLLDELKRALAWREVVRTTALGAEAVDAVLLVAPPPLSEGGKRLMDPSASDAAAQAERNHR